MHKDFSIAGRLLYSADMFLKIKTVCLHYVIPEMHGFSMRPEKYFYDKPLSKYLDVKTVLIYHPHPVFSLIWMIQSFPSLKVPKCGIFDHFDFRSFYTMKSLWVGNFGAQI